MQSSSRDVRLKRSHARVLAGASLTFRAVPFSSKKPKFDSDISGFLDSLSDSIIEERRQLKNPDEDVFVSLSLEEIRQLAGVLQSILTEGAADDIDPELFVVPRDDVLTCLRTLRAGN